MGDCQGFGQHPLESEERLNGRMPSETHHRALKSRLDAQFARIGRALASPCRLELLHLLAGGERTVEELADAAGLSLANASQHLQGLREACLVESRKQGVFVFYRPADAEVSALTRTVRLLAARRLPEIDRLIRPRVRDGANKQPRAVETIIACILAGGRHQRRDAAPPRSSAPRPASLFQTGET